MAEVKSFSPGNFNWFELATTDPNSAKQFYSNIFGWEINDFPMPDGTNYTMLKKQGKDVGALYDLPPDEVAMGLPPHWRIYVSVADVDASTKKAEELGAKIQMPPFASCSDNRFRFS